MRRAGIAGAALVEFIVDDQGKVRDARTFRATHEDFGAAATAAIMTWKFNPGLKNGRPVATRMQEIIRFELNENY
jgi:protein TonB